MPMFSRRVRVILRGTLRVGALAFGVADLGSCLDVGIVQRYVLRFGNNTEKFSKFFYHA